jgi:hypothetical protein
VCKEETRFAVFTKNQHQEKKYKVKSRIKNGEQAEDKEMKA